MSLKASAQKVQGAVTALGYDFNILEFSETTRTSAEAAAAIGCTVGQIAKSLVFKAKVSGKAILVIASGNNRVNEKLIKAELGEKISRPDAEFVREQTGFAIGGIPPIGHAQVLTTFLKGFLKTCARSLGICPTDCPRWRCATSWRTPLRTG